MESPFDREARDTVKPGRKEAVMRTLWNFCDDSSKKPQDTATREIPIGAAHAATR
jgi:hypothetical protein